MSADRGFTMLADRVAHGSKRTGGLGGRSVTAATCQFDALCEGLALVELRSPQFLSDDPERTWREAGGALVAGFRHEPPATHLQTTSAARAGTPRSAGSNRR